MSKFIQFKIKCQFTLNYSQQEFILEYFIDNISYEEIINAKFNQTIDFVDLIYGFGKIP